MVGAQGGAVAFSGKYTKPQLDLFPLRSKNFKLLEEGQTTLLFPGSKWSLTVAVKRDRGLLRLGEDRITERPQMPETQGLSDTEVRRGQCKHHFPLPLHALGSHALSNTQQQTIAEKGSRAEERTFWSVGVKGRPKAKGETDPKKLFPSKPFPRQSTRSPHRNLLLEVHSLKVTRVTAKLKLSPTPSEMNLMLHSVGLGEEGFPFLGLNVIWLSLYLRTQDDHFPAKLWDIQKRKENRKKEKQQLMFKGQNNQHKQIKNELDIETNNKMGQFYTGYGN